MQIAGGLLAAGSADQAKAALEYLVAVQEADGDWVQNSWLDGRPYWKGVQLDETAFPILLYDMLLRAGAIKQADIVRYRHDRGRRWLYSPQRTGYAAGSLGGRCRLFAVYFSHRDRGVLAAADAMEAAGKTTMAHYMREFADGWNEQIDDWTYAVETVSRGSLASRVTTSASAAR